MSGTGIAKMVAAAALPLLVAATPVHVVVHVAVQDGKPVATDRWIDARIADASKAFAAAGVQFVRAPAPSAAAMPADVMTVRQRHGLAAHAPRDGRIHVFVVAKLADKDKSGAVISGVHWRYAGGKRKLRGRRYVILSTFSRASTLAHELGHFFGLPHSTGSRWLMTTPLRLPGATFNHTQLRRVRRNLARYVRRGFLVPVQASK